MQFIGLKDILDDTKSNHGIKVARYRNAKQKKYGNCYIYTWNDDIINKVMNNNRDFIINYEGAVSDTYKSHEYRALITDEDYNFKLFIEFTKREVSDYSKVKDIIPNYKDSGKVILKYFKVLEIFDNK